MDKSFKKLAKPYLIWLYVLALFPVIVMFVLTFIKNEGLSFEDIKFGFTNYLELKDISIIKAFYNSILYSFLSTTITLVLGYFIAYKLYRSKIKNKSLILTILILPMWSNLLLRVYALSNLMEENNIITNLLNIDKGIGISGTPLSIIIGLVFTYLPFMILPIYNALEKIDSSLEEAALDLGLTDFKKFYKVIIPLSSKGIITGIIMVFLPSLSGFAIPQILGKGNVLLIGNIIEQYFKNMNYNFGSLLSIFILVFIFLALYINSKVNKDGETLI